MPKCFSTFLSSSGIYKVTADIHFHTFCRMYNYVPVGPHTNETCIGQNLQTHPADVHIVLPETLVNIT